MRDPGCHLAGVLLAERPRALKARRRAGCVSRNGCAMRLQVLAERAPHRPATSSISGAATPDACPGGVKPPRAGSLGVSGARTPARTSFALLAERPRKLPGAELLAERPRRRGRDDADGHGAVDNLLAELPQRGSHANSGVHLPLIARGRNAISGPAHIHRAQAAPSLGLRGLLVFLLVFSFLVIATSRRFRRCREDRRRPFQ